MATKVQQSSAGRSEEQKNEYEELAGGNRFLVFTAAPSWLTSMLIHIVMLLILAIITLPYHARDAFDQLVIGPQDSTEEFDEIEKDFEPMNMEVMSDDLPAEFETETVADDVTEVMPATDLTAAAIQVQVSDFGEQIAPQSDLLATTGALIGSALDGRGGANRARLAREGGASKGSEAAVALALKWFYNHQNPDGSWNFDFRGGPCRGRCPNHATAGMVPARSGATAMALLPFLGAGHTHKEGKYKKTVGTGLKFLVRQMKVEQKQGVPVGGLWEAGGNMYSHGLASIALCEAYGMTRDQKLMQPAQLSLNFISYAQDPVGGGWRYSPGEAGDTSVVGWQLMALKSGQMAYLHVDPKTFVGAVKFLDFVQTDYGSKYGYNVPGAGEATSAIGLLCRMYQGWKKSHQGMSRGVQWISDHGPSDGNMYFNYYATQVMRHYGGEKWKKWNVKMRDFLVGSQEKVGHKEGSWYMAGGHGSSAGRLYCTSMATMVLEVYYRHLPIYQQQATQDDFPL